MHREKFAVLLIVITVFFGMSLGSYADITGGNENGGGSEGIESAKELKPSSITLTNKTAEYTGETIKIDKAAVEGSTGPVTYYYYSNSTCTRKISVPKETGIYYVKATVKADGNYDGATSNVAKLSIEYSMRTVKLNGDYKFKLISNDKYLIQSKSGSHVLASSKASKRCRIKVQPYSNSSSYVILRNDATGRVLAATSTSVTWKKNDRSRSTRWRIKEAGDGSYYLYSARKHAYLKYNSKKKHFYFTKNMSRYKRGNFKKYNTHTLPMMTLKGIQNAIDTASATDSVRTVNCKYSIDKKKKNEVISAVKNLRKKGISVSFVMADLQTGEGISYNADKLFYSASSIKGPYICAMNYYMPNTAKRYKKSIRKSITVSSNNAYERLWNAGGLNMWKKYVERSDVNYYEMCNGSSKWPYVSSRNMAKIWCTNYNYFLSGEKNSTWVKEYFRHPEFSFISEAFDGKYRTYSKAGWIYDSGYKSYSDAGVVIRGADGRGYVAAIMTDGSIWKDSHKAGVKRLARAIDGVYTDMRYRN